MKKLFVCSESFAGQLPFASTIVNTIRDKDTFGIFMCTPKCDYRKTIIPNGENYTFLTIPTSKFKKLLHIIYPIRLLKKIEHICKTNEIDIIHLLTADSSLAVFLKRLKKQATLFYTVHDLFYHEKVSNYFSPGTWRNKLEKSRIEYIIRHAENLVTCSSVQYQWMLTNFREQHIFFHNFPTLVTETIQTGNAAVPELKGIKNYILFFGLIEQYKGVDLLYNAYLDNEESMQGRTLVIAGKGNIYFERNLAKETHVLFINRYIDDNEVKELYRNAFCVVFPYISGTQSGILSLSYYFKIPAIVSNIPFFNTAIIDHVTAISFDIKDPHSIPQKIKELETLKENMVTEGYVYYQRHYDEELLRYQLLYLYDSLNSTSQLPSDNYSISASKLIN
jgi:glycosyltransferase involved in cell wall biosynthesis